MNFPKKDVEYMGWIIVLYFFGNILSQLWSYFHYKLSMLKAMLHMTMIYYVALPGLPECQI